MQSWDLIVTLGIMEAGLMKKGKGMDERRIRFTILSVFEIAAVSK